MSDDPRLSLLLALADDELILGHRLSEWTGWVPYIEEDLALSSIAQDEMAHARALYEIVSSLDGRSVDELALGRAPADYRNAVLCERPNRDFAHTIARHWLYETADDIRLGALETSTFKDLREVVSVLRLEEQFHLEHAATWFHRLAAGPDDARHRFAAALGATIGEARAMFEPLPDEASLIADGTLPRAHETLLAEWLARIGHGLNEAGLNEVLAGEAGASGAGGRSGRHSEDFAPLWEEMTALYRAHPGVRW